MSKSQVLESLRTFFPYITAREVKDLVGPGNLSLDKLKHLLFHPDVPVGVRACFFFACDMQHVCGSVGCVLKPCIPYL